MADITGAIYEEHEGKRYCLRLTLRAIAKLQGIHGNDLGGLLSGAEGVPAFGPLLDMVAEALERGSDIEQEAAADLADEMLTADVGVAQRLINAAFPDAGKEGNGAAPKKRKS